MTGPAEVLPWDTDFFGVRVARARIGGAFTAEEGTALIDWCGANRIGWLYALVPPDPASIREAERCEMALTDVRVELACVPDAIPVAPGSVRPLRGDDLAAMRELARTGHRDSRFFADPRVPEERAEALFMRWIERDSTAGDNSWAAVAVAEDRPLGYITANLDAGRCGWIRLIAVSQGARGLGIGSALVGAAGRWMRDRGAVEARVITQGRNIAAQRLYQQNGFRTSSVNLWYHKWFTP